jgi:hypothetical protein
MLQRSVLYHLATDRQRCHTINKVEIDAGSHRRRYGYADTLHGRIRAPALGEWRYGGQKALHDPPAVLRVTLLG